MYNSSNSNNNNNNNNNKNNHNSNNNNRNSSSNNNNSYYSNNNNNSSSTGICEKNTPPDKKTGWKISFESAKSGAGLQFLSLDCRAKAHLKECVFTDSRMSIAIQLDIQRPCAGSADPPYLGPWPLYPPPCLPR